MKAVSVIPEIGCVPTGDIVDEVQIHPRMIRERQGAFHLPVVHLSPNVPARSPNPLAPEMVAASPPRLPPIANL